MKQKWKKLGLIFCPHEINEWMQSHASVPIAENIDGDLFRVYFSTRNKSNKSYTGNIVFDIKNPTKILEYSDKPVLSPGDLGCFDDSGSMATWICEHNDIRYLYYIGWNLGVTVPFRNSIGLAVSKDGNEFTRIAKGPILDRTMSEPHFVASCCVIPGKIWRMWYLSCTGWFNQAGNPMHRYHIKYAESCDGINWKRDGVVSIDYANDNEYAISRPSVVRDPNQWHMWYSYRGERYKIGYATSNDGVSWERHDDNIIFESSTNDWDSDMMEYPYVFDHGNDRYMLYNGNGYGRSGFGLAILESV